MKDIVNFLIFIACKNLFVLQHESTNPNFPWWWGLSMIPFLQLRPYSPRSMTPVKARREGASAGSRQNSQPEPLSWCTLAHPDLRFLCLCILLYLCFLSFF